MFVFQSETACLSISRSLKRFTQEGFILPKLEPCVVLRRQALGGNLARLLFHLVLSQEERDQGPTFARLSPSRLYSCFLCQIATKKKNVSYPSRWSRADSLRSKRLEDELVRPEQAWPGEIGGRRVWNLSPRIFAHSCSPYGGICLHLLPLILKYCGLKLFSP